MPVRRDPKTRTEVTPFKRGFTKTHARDGIAAEAISNHLKSAAPTNFGEPSGNPWQRPALDAAFFAQNACEVARQLVGAWLLFAPPNGPRRWAWVLETEAYRGDDPACHAFTTAKKPDPHRRGAALFGPPGTAYVYLNYGVHWLLNVVAEPEGQVGAALIRALEPIAGFEPHSQCNGPGKLTRALGIAGELHGALLTAPPLWFALPERPPFEVAVSARIGISKGTERPWRYFAAGHPGVSRGRPGKSPAKKRRPK